MSAASRSDVLEAINGHIGNQQRLRKECGQELGLTFHTNRRQSPFVDVTHAGSATMAGTWWTAAVRTMLRVRAWRPLYNVQYSLLRHHLIGAASELHFHRSKIHL